MVRMGNGLEFYIKFEDVKQEEYGYLKTKVYRIVVELNMGDGFFPYHWPVFYERDEEGIYRRYLTSDDYAFVWYE